MRTFIRSNATGLYVEYPAVLDSVVVTQIVDERDVATFTLEDTTGTLLLSRGQGVRIDNGTGTIFEGYVVNATHARLGLAGVRHITVDAVSQVYLADKRIVQFAYANETAGDIARDLIDRYLADEGVTPGVIDNGVFIEQITFNWISVSEALELLAKRSRYFWTINNDKTLDFAPPAIRYALLATEDEVTITTEAGGALEARTTLETTIFDDDPVYDEFNVLADSINQSRDRELYRNRQFVRGGRGRTDAQTEIQTGDGEKRAFVVGYPIAVQPTISINTGSGFVQVPPEDVGVRGLQDERDWLFTFNSPVVNQNALLTPLSSTDLIKIEYVGLFDVVARVDNLTLQNTNAVLEGGSGVVENVVVDRGVNTSPAAFARASQAIDTFSRDLVEIRFATRDLSFAEPGSIVRVNFPNESLPNATAFIQTVELFTFNGDERAIITALSNSDLTAPETPSVGSWASFFADFWNRSGAALEESGGEATIVTQPLNFERDWLETDTPNLFRRPLPGAGLYPGSLLTPAVDFDDRVLYLAWYRDVSGVLTEIGRKAVTSTLSGVLLETEGEAIITLENDALLTIAADEDEVVTVTVLGTGDALGLIEEFGWWGGSTASGIVGTGVEFDRQPLPGVPINKTEAQVLQVTKTDRKWS